MKRQRIIKLKLKNQKAQALIIILLVMTVALSLGLAASRQITTDIKVTRQQEESAKAYSAAEAGIEKALSTGETGEIRLETNIATAVTQGVIGGKSSFAWPNPITKGDGIIFWLEGHNDDGSLKSDLRYTQNFNIYWQEESGTTKPAVFIALFYNNGNSIEYFSADPDANRRNDNHFSAPSQTGSFSLDGINFSSKITIANSGKANPVFAWVRVLYATAWLGFDNTGSGANLLPQGTLFTSTGQVAPEGSETVVSRRLQSVKTYKQPPQILLEPLVSFGNIEAQRILLP